MNRRNVPAAAENTIPPVRRRPAAPVTRSAAALPPYDGPADGRNTAGFGAHADAQPYGSNASGETDVFAAGEFPHSRPRSQGHPHDRGLALGHPGISAAILDLLNRAPDATAGPLADLVRTQRLTLLIAQACGHNPRPPRGTSGSDASGGGRGR
ncbi:hypothetical protein [Streptomyces sp. NBC_01334]|uniref:hypothetical protein n=1 Tax=Streptomyces sp. NBC_01334 TaxID=2903827 RepID=UPI002E12FC45|nr:hypothetical protein OG736_06205 [Streptomyces sp. NBC_01334]